MEAKHVVVDAFFVVIGVFEMFHKDVVFFGK